MRNYRLEFVLVFLVLVGLLVLGISGFVMIEPWLYWLAMICFGGGLIMLTILNIKAKSNGSPPPAKQDDDLGKG
jgi:cyanate permease